MDCELAWALTRLKKNGRVTNPRRGVWALAKAPPVEPPLAAPATRTRLDDLQALPYHQYLRTPEWRETRAAALVRARHACALDATHTGDLDVHHRTYDRIGQELPDDLLVLCRSCHELHHKANGRPRRPDQRPTSSSPPGFVATTGPPATPTSERSSLLRRLLSR